INGWNDLITIGNSSGHIHNKGNENPRAKDQIHDLRSLVCLVERGSGEVVLSDFGALLQTCQLPCLNIKHEKNYEMKNVVECFVRMLLMGKYIVPITFMFRVLRCALAWNAEKGCSIKLENKITTQLDQATVVDLLLPLKNDNDEIDDLGILEMESMQHIVYLFMSQQIDVGEESDYSIFNEGNASSHSSNSSNPFACNVIRVWDEYLTEMATLSNVSPDIFLDLVETVPSSSRPIPDHLYKDIHLYLKEKPVTSSASSPRHWLPIPEAENGLQHELLFEFSMLEISLEVVYTYMDSNVADLE
ncbi:hypothetical protein KI387_035533, partial [Taxus chinensis]